MNKKSKAEDNQWVTIGQVLIAKGEDSRTYFKANKYKGRLVWQQYGGADGNDPEESQYYEIESVALMKPFKGTPPFVKEVLRLNLKNPKAAKVLE
jgi:hypothetical protein